MFCLFYMEWILCQYLSNKSSVLQINTICFAKKNSTFKQTQRDLQIQNSIWEKMQTYGQICIVLQLWDSFAFLWGNLAWFSHKCLLADFSQMRAGSFSHKCVLADFLTNACRLIFSHVQLSNFLFQKTDGAVGQFIINHLDVFTKRPYYSVSEIHNKCCKVVNMID